MIAEPGDQRRLGTDHHQPDVLGLAEGADRVMIGHVEIDAAGVFGDPRIARRGVETVPRSGQQAGLRQLPRQRMFAATRTQQKDIHGERFSG